MSVWNYALKKKPPQVKGGGLSWRNYSRASSGNPIQLKNSTAKTPHVVSKQCERKAGKDWATGNMPGNKQKCSFNWHAMHFQICRSLIGAGAVREIPWRELPARMLSICLPRHQARPRSRRSPRCRSRARYNPACRRSCPKADADAVGANLRAGVSRLRPGLPPAAPPHLFAPVTAKFLPSHGIAQLDGLVANLDDLPQCQIGVMRAHTRETARP